MTTLFPTDLPAESLTCRDCDAQEDSLCRALIHGWREIQYAPDGLSYNFVGICPLCAAAEIQADSESRKRYAEEIKATRKRRAPSGGK